MRHQATRLVEVKGRRFLVALQKSCRPLQREAFGSRPICDGCRPGKSHPDCSRGKAVRELGCTEARTGHEFLQPKRHLVGKSQPHVSQPTKMGVAGNVKFSVGGEG